MTERLEKEIRLIPPAGGTVDVDAAGLRYVGRTTWDCVSVYLDTPATELLDRDASLSINHAPGHPRPIGWYGFKAGVRVDGVVRHAIDVRHYHGLPTVPEVAEVLASDVPPVERATGLVAREALAAVLLLTQRRTQHRYVTGDGAEVIVSEDELSARPPTEAPDVRRFRLVEVDLTDVAEDAAVWPFVEKLIAGGMVPTPLPKYALGMRLLRS